MDLTFTNLLIVMAVGFAAPLLLGFAPAVRVPSVVLEIVAGIIVGPSVLGWVSVDAPVAVFSLVGLAFLLFLAGLEIEFSKLRGRVLRLASLGFAVSFAIAIVVGLLLKAGGFVSTRRCSSRSSCRRPRSACSSRCSRTRGRAATTFGQLVIAGGTIADFATVILLSLFFSREASSTATKVILLVGLFVAAALVALVILRAEHSIRIGTTLRRLQDTTAQIRVRARSCC